MIPVNDILSTLTMIQMSGGGTYKNENKTITENGVFKPDDGVRWNEVTVDVPQSDMLTAISQFPVYGGGSVGSDYHFLVHMGRLLRNDQYTWGTIEKDDGITEEIITTGRHGYDAWILLYRNADNKPLVAFEVTDTVANAMSDATYYSTYNGNLIGEYHVIAITDVMAEVARLSSGSTTMNTRARISITGISAKQRQITYDAYTGEVTKDIIKTYSIPPNKHFYAYFGGFCNGYCDISSTSTVITLNGMGEEDTKQLVNFLDTTDTIPIL